MVDFRWRSSCIISSVIQLDTMLAFMLSFSLALSAFLFCRIYLASFSSGRIG